MLARMILRELESNPWGECAAIRPVIIRNALTVFDYRFFDMRKVSSKILNGEWDVLEAIAEPRLVVLDDVGSDYDPKKIVASKVDRALRDRKGLWTVVTTNLGMGEVAEMLDSRIASWLIRDSNQVVKLTAQDFALVTR
jgi:DNA replication protein DnaC